MSKKPPLSRCCVPQTNPLTWHHFVDEGHAEVVAVADWLNSLPPVVRQTIDASIEELLGLAAEGALESDDASVIQPVARYPDLWELKWHFSTPKGRAELRQYHAEPKGFEQVLLAVHKHLKGRGSRQAVRDAQNASMAMGQLRYRAGEASTWGLT